MQKDTLKAPQREDTAVLEKKSIRILQVEDDAVDRKLVERVLTRCPQPVDFSVESVERLSVALQCLANRDYDLALLDLGLPDSKGIEIIQKVQQVNPNIPVVVLTGLDDEETGLLAIKNGATDYLIKGPMLNDLLVRAVLYALERKKASDALRESERKYRSFVQNFKGIAFQNKLDFTPAFIHGAVEEITGYKEQQFTEGGLKWNEIIFPPDLDQFYKTGFLLKLRTVPGFSTDHEYRIVRKDGQVRWVREVVQNICDNFGKPALVQGTIQDITERKEAEKALKESELKFRTIFESAGGAIFIVDIETGEILDCNSKAEKITGLRREQIIGLHQSELHPKEEREKYKEKFAAHIQKGHIADYEGEVQHIDGRKIPVWISTQSVKIGGKDLIVGLFIDITERKKSQLELLAAEERYRTIFENSAVAIMMADEQEQLVSWNKFTEGLLEMDTDDLYLKPVKSLYPGTEWEKIKTQNIRQKGMQHHLETKMFKKNGEVIDVNLSLSVVRNAKEQVIGTIGVVSDITERKKAEQKIKEAMEMKSEFISTVSHELRTPLTSMKESISIVLDQVAGPINDDQRKFLDVAKRNLERLSRLINDVLDFQKFDSGKMRFDMQENDINDLATEVYDMMLSPVKQRKLKLTLRLEDNLPKIKFDRDRIIQVLINLVNNAIKSTEKGKITIGTRKKKNIILVSVSDTGEGIKQEDLPRLFRKFEQLEKGGERKTGGTGLGLVISEEIIKEHNAKIWAESETGKGTTFYFVLPIVERRAEPRRNH